MSRLNIFCGHYGSGKTEVAVNYAIAQSKAGKKVTVVDMDTVNPYFRTADAEYVFKKYGIELIASQFANTNLDIPTLPQDIKRVFCDTERTVVFDVGGDDDGAFALGQFNSYFKNESYKMFLVVNTKRPLTKNCDELYTIAKNIEIASRLNFTDIVNNSNIGKFTDENTLLSDIDEIIKLSEKMGIPIGMMSGIPKALEGVGDDYEDIKFPMEIYIKMPWEQ